MIFEQFLSSRVVESLEQKQKRAPLGAHFVSGGAASHALTMLLAKKSHLSVAFLDLRTQR